MKPYKPQRTSVNLLFPMITLGIGAAIGYVGNNIVNPRDGYTIKDGVISHENAQQRIISNQKGVIQVGNVTERVNDLLYENPNVIKSTVEDLYQKYASE